MESNFEKLKNELYFDAEKIINSSVMFKKLRMGEKFDIEVEKSFEVVFFKLIDKVNLSLMEEKDNFYGYFLFQMDREIRFDINTPTAINFKGAKYVIYFNPIIFLQLNIKQMESTIKHEIHHILSMHLVRAKELKGNFSTLAINLAMDIVVNQYINNLPPYAITLKGVNLKYGLNLEPFNTFEYYAENIQNVLNVLEESDEGEEDDSTGENLDNGFDIEKAHDLWNENESLDEKMLKDFTEKIISNAEKGVIPIHIEGMISNLRQSKSELPWNLYLKKLMGTVESNKKKTITRRNRRQPNRLDLRGELRNHKAEIIVAIDISGSISDEEFKQAVKEVLSIVKNYNHEITIVECDKEIKNAYKVKNIYDIKDRCSSGGGTRFTPVFEYANNKNSNLLVYFTDGKGEDRLQIKPRGYKVLWVISGRGDKLSLKEPYGAVKKLSRLEIKDNIVDMKDVRNDGYSMNNQEPIF
ncbi:VWA-like domain-containing protein [uncultured Clostridium sp.]|uniref:vWA domain-containing protein n=1 Tax=uncultured Clostridium sp. TaxID=59620 RepID=UPI00260527BE|nr:VWA-like domain-containing protein [uncultured Clostridium sp.]